MPERPLTGPTDSTSATPTSGRGLLGGVDVVCHQAALVGAGARVADLPAYAAHNDLGTAALLAAMHAAGVGRLVLASSMVVYGEGRYACPEHGDQRPPPRTRAALDGRATSRTTARSAAPTWTGSRSTRTPGSTRAAATPRARSPRSTTRPPGSGRPRRAAIALRYHNVYGPGMPRDTPYSGVAAMFRSSIERGEPPQVFEDGRQMRDFVHVADVARANVLALARGGRRRRRDVRRLQRVLRASPVSIGEVAGLVVEGTGADLAPEVTGGYRLGDVRHVVALARARPATELGFSAAVSAPPRGCAASPRRRCGPERLRHEAITSS